MPLIRWGRRSQPQVAVEEEDCDSDSTYCSDIELTRKRDVQNQPRPCLVRGHGPQEDASHGVILEEAEMESDHIPGLLLTPFQPKVKPKYPTVLLANRMETQEGEDNTPTVEIEHRLGVSKNEKDRIFDSLLRSPVGPNVKPSSPAVLLSKRVETQEGEDDTPTVDIEQRLSGLKVWDDSMLHNQFEPKLKAATVLVDDPMETQDENDRIVDSSLRLDVERKGTPVTAALLLDKLMETQEDENLLRIDPDPKGTSETSADLTGELMETEETEAGSSSLDTQHRSDTPLATVDGEISQCSSEGSFALRTSKKRTRKSEGRRELKGMEVVDKGRSTEQRSDTRLATEDGNISQCSSEGSLVVRTRKGRPRKSGSVPQLMEKRGVVLRSSNIEALTKKYEERTCRDENSEKVRKKKKKDRKQRSGGSAQIFGLKRLNELRMRLAELKTTVRTALFFNGEPLTYQKASDFLDEVRGYQKELQSACWLESVKVKMAQVRELQQVADKICCMVQKSFEFTQQSLIETQESAAECNWEDVDSMDELEIILLSSDDEVNFVALRDVEDSMSIISLCSSPERATNQTQEVEQMLCSTTGVFQGQAPGQQSHINEYRNRMRKECSINFVKNTLNAASCSLHEKGNINVKSSATHSGNETVPVCEELKRKLQVSNEQYRSVQKRKDLLVDHPKEQLITKSQLAVSGKMSGGQNVDAMLHRQTDQNMSVKRIAENMSSQNVQSQNVEHRQIGQKMPVKRIAENMSSQNLQSQDVVHRQTSQKMPVKRTAENMSSQNLQSQDVVHRQTSQKMPVKRTAENMSSQNVQSQNIRRTETNPKPFGKTSAGSQAGISYKDQHVESVTKQSATLVSKPLTTSAGFRSQYTNSNALPQGSSLQKKNPPNWFKGLILEKTPSSSSGFRQQGCRNVKNSAPTEHQLLDDSPEVAQLTVKPRINLKNGTTLKTNAKSSSQGCPSKQKLFDDSQTSRRPEIFYPQPQLNRPCFRSMGVLHNMSELSPNTDLARNFWSVPYPDFPEGDCDM